MNKTEREKIMYECKIAEKLTELRLKKGVTQEDVAQSLSVSNKTVSKWENASSIPDIPMLVKLVKLADYYGVTTDALLGLTDDRPRDTKETVRLALDGLCRKDAFLKAFEMELAIIPALFDKVAGDRVDDADSVLPTEYLRAYRSQVAVRDYFQFTASSADVNLVVTQLRNKNNFAWLNDPEKQKRISTFFRFLSDENALSILYFIHSTKCTKNFTADFVSKNTGVPQERVSSVLKQFCTVGECRRMEAHLSEGDIDIYECFGDGIILAVISLAYDRMCGRKYYNYHYNNTCKMIGGE